MRHLLNTYVQADPAAIAGRLRSAGLEVAACGLVEPSLEDVFLDVAERKAVA